VSHRTRRQMARHLASPKPLGARVTHHLGEIVSVTGTTAQIWLNGDTSVQIGPVSIAPGLTVAAGQVVELTFEGQAPTVTRRIT
jgi:hypothetical protein